LPYFKALTSYFNVIINFHFSGGVFDILVPMPSQLGMSFKRNHILKCNTKALARFSLAPMHNVFPLHCFTLALLSSTTIVVALLLSVVKTIILINCNEKEKK
jgi:hypothetical protein